MSRLMASPVTLQQIADKAGVSRMTVSRALRNAPEVAASTRRRIQALADALGYSPDPLIQRLTSHLAHAHRRNEGQVIAWINSYKERRPRKGQIPFVSIYRGAAARAQKLGFQLEEFWLGEPGMTGRKLSRILYQRGIECLILPPVETGVGHLTMDWDKFSPVAVGYSMVVPRLHRVGSHHLHGTREAIRQLYRRGYRRIGLCISKDANLRLDHACLEAMTYYQFRTPKKYWVKTLVQEKFSDEVTLRWLKKEQPDSIISHYEWLPETLARGGYRVPEDVAVAFLNLDYSKPGVTGIDQRYAIIGETASDLVIGQHYRNEKGIPATPHTVMIEGRWVDGSTVLRKAVKV